MPKIKNSIYLLTQDHIGLEISKFLQSSISKTPDRKVKRTKIWDSGSYGAYMQGTLMPDSLSLVWGDLVHFAKFLIIRNFCSHRTIWAGNFKTLPLQQFSSHPPKLYENIAYHGAMQAITLLGKSAKFYKIYVTLKF